MSGGGYDVIGYWVGYDEVSHGEYYDVIGYVGVSGDGGYDVIVLGVV